MKRSASLPLRDGNCLLEGFGRKARIPRMISQFSLFSTGDIFGESPSQKPAMLNTHTLNHGIHVQKQRFSFPGKLGTLSENFVAVVMKRQGSRQGGVGCAAVRPGWPDLAFVARCSGMATRTRTPQVNGELFRWLNL